jgi:hypothetical protein
MLAWASDGKKARAVSANASTESALRIFLI